MFDKPHSVMRLSGKPKRGPGQRRMLTDLRRGETGRLRRLFLPYELASSMRDAGFVPGTLITFVHASPCGSMGVYRVDGTEIALRRELTAALQIERSS